MEKRLSCRRLWLTFRLRMATATTTATTSRIPSCQPAIGFYVAQRENRLNSGQLKPHTGRNLLAHDADKAIEFDVTTSTFAEKKPRDEVVRRSVKRSCARAQMAASRAEREFLPRCYRVIQGRLVGLTSIEFLISSRDSKRKRLKTVQ